MPRVIRGMQVSKDGLTSRAVSALPSRTGRPAEASAPRPGVLRNPTSRTATGSGSRADRSRAACRRRWRRSPVPRPSDVGGSMALTGSQAPRRLPPRAAVCSDCGSPPGRAASPLRDSGWPSRTASRLARVAASDKSCRRLSVSPAARAASVPRSTKRPVSSAAPRLPRRLGREQHARRCAARQLLLLEDTGSHLRLPGERRRCRPPSAGRAREASAPPLHVCARPPIPREELEGGLRRTSRLLGAERIEEDLASAGRTRPSFRERLPGRMVEEWGSTRSSRPP